MATDCIFDFEIGQYFKVIRTELKGSKDLMYKGGKIVDRKFSQDVEIMIVKFPDGTIRDCHCRHAPENYELIDEMQYRLLVADGHSF